MATPLQIETYVKACTRKGVLPLNLNGMTNTEASAEMQRVFKLPHPNQLKHLKELLTELIDMGAQVNGKPVVMPSDKFFAKLNEDDTSEWIKRSYQIKSKNLNIAPPDKAQMEKLLNMYAMQDIPWHAMPVVRTEMVDVWNDEGYTEKRKSTINTEINLSREYIFNEDGSKFMVIKGKREQQGYRLRTREEFEKACMEQLKHIDASEIISKYEGEFIRWNRDRITDEQISIIQDLERQLSNTFNPRPAQEQSTQDVPFGDDEMPFEIVQHTPSRRGQRWNPQSFNPTPLHVLKEFNKKEAHAYIQQLTSERDRTDIVRFAEGQYAMEFTNRKDYEGVERTHRQSIIKSEWNGRKGFIEFMDDTTLETVRVAQDAKRWKQDEFARLNDVLFALQAVAGFSIEEFMGEAAQVFFGGGEENIAQVEHLALELRGKIREVMVKCIKDQSITFHGLMNMIDKSELAQDIFLSIE